MVAGESRAVVGGLARYPAWNLIVAVSAAARALSTARIAGSNRHDRQTDRCKDYDLYSQGHHVAKLRDPEP